jgi:hypothetical protein
MASGSAQKRRLRALLVNLNDVAGKVRLSSEVKAYYIKRLTPLWAVQAACPNGSIGHQDATAEIIALTEECVRHARECVVKQDQAQSQAPASHQPASVTPDQLQPTSQTASETLLITAMREHSAALNNHAAALDRHTAAIEEQMRGADHN